MCSIFQGWKKIQKTALLTTVYKRLWNTAGGSCGQDGMELSGGGNFWLALSSTYQWAVEQFTFSGNITQGVFIGSNHVQS